MNAIKSYVISILTVSLLAAVFDILLPEGNMKKYSSGFIGLIVSLVMVMPLSGVLNTKITIPEISESQSIDENEYKKMLEEEFCQKTAQLIEEKSARDIKAEVKASLSDDTKIDKVIIYGEPDSSTMFYITEQLGVRREDVEIRR